MAYIRLTEDEQGNLVDPTPNLSVGGSTTTDSTTTTVGPTPVTNTQTAGFSNLQNYLNANNTARDNILGDVTGSVNASTDNARNILESANTRYLDEINSSRHSYNPSGNLDEQISNVWNGPGAFNETDYGREVSTAIQEANDRANLTSTVGGQTELLDQQYNTPDRDYETSAGGLNLDQFLMSNPLDVARLNANSLSDRYNTMLTNQQNALNDARLWNQSVADQAAAEKARLAALANTNTNTTVGPTTGVTSTGTSDGTQTGTTTVGPVGVDNTVVGPAPVQPSTPEPAVSTPNATPFSGGVAGTFTSPWGTTIEYDAYGNQREQAFSTGVAGTFTSPWGTTIEYDAYGNQREQAFSTGVAGTFTSPWGTTIEYDAYGNQREQAGATPTPQVTPNGNYGSDNINSGGGSGTIGNTSTTDSGLSYGNTIGVAGITNPLSTAGMGATATNAMMGEDTPQSTLATVGTVIGMAVGGPVVAVIGAGIGQFLSNITDDNTLGMTNAVNNANASIAQDVDTPDVADHWGNLLGSSESDTGSGGDGYSGNGYGSGLGGGTHSGGGHDPG